MSTEQHHIALTRTDAKWILDALEHERANLRHRLTVTSDEDDAADIANDEMVLSATLDKIRLQLWQVFGADIENRSRQPLS